MEIAAKLIKSSFTSEEQAIIIDSLASSLKTDLDYLQATTNKQDAIP